MLPKLSENILPRGDDGAPATLALFLLRLELAVVVNPINVNQPESLLIARQRGAAGSVWIGRVCQRTHMVARFRQASPFVP
eukprot:COSAG03_NODE_546_length_7007_cov_4.067892_3_plen_81_part_00